MVFCGTFQTKGARYSYGNGQLGIARQGEINKLVAEVEQITFSGTQALSQLQEVIYVTERAVFRLQQDGVVLIEIAPGIDLQEDVLDQMGFRPLIADSLAEMDRSFFVS